MQDEGLLDELLQDDDWFDPSNNLGAALVEAEQNRLQAP